MAGQNAIDRPDLVAYVFHRKQQALLKKVHGGFFGAVAGLVYTIEYQKCGLPHMHLLIFLEGPDKIRNVQQVDAFISAQIPDPEQHPQLYEAVSKYMLHGPCTPERCLDNGKCKKHFPKSFSEQTVMNDNGYPEYARPDNGRTILKGETTFTNKDVVPHSRQLLAEFDCHINVEVCASINSVKYIHKYIYKGPDRATLQTQGHDEVKAYLDSRYISSVQATWHLLEFPMHLEYPSVYRLPVHLENEQNVTFQENDVAQQVVEEAAQKDTQLMGWFKANADPTCIAAGAHDCLYQDFPKKFVWNRKKWTPRQRQKAIGRMYSVPPNGGERFYLRLLLTEVKGMCCLFALSLNFY
jgi:hypothetical protein